MLLVEISIEYLNIDHILPECAIKGTRDNFKIHVNFMKPTYSCSLRQDEAYDKK